MTRVNTLDSILARVDVSDCWVWTGSCNHKGYGRVGFGGRQWAVHRLIWEQLVGPIPEGLELDHLCRNPPCVNPDHLEPVTHRENLLRSSGITARAAKVTACPQGHLYTPENSRLRARGRRECRTCRRLRHQIRKRQRRLDALERVAS